MSMKPGATIRPEASISRCPSRSLQSPTAVMRPFLMANVAAAPVSHSHQSPVHHGSIGLPSVAPRYRVRWPVSPPPVTSQPIAPWTSLRRLRQGPFRRHAGQRHGDSLRQNRLVLHDLNARCEVADECPPHQDGSILQDRPGSRPRTPKSSYWWQLRLPLQPSSGARNRNCRKECDERRVEWRVDSTKNEDPPSAANYHPSNPYHPDTHATLAACSGPTPDPIATSNTDGNGDANRNTGTACKRRTQRPHRQRRQPFPQSQRNQHQPKHPMGDSLPFGFTTRVPTVRSLQRRARVHR